MENISLNTSIDAGLPNIEAAWDRSNRNIVRYNDDSFEGAFSVRLKDANYKVFVDSGGSYSGGSLIFDASLSNPEIYGNSSTVTPLSLSCVHIMKY